MAWELVEDEEEDRQEQDDDQNGGPGSGPDRLPSGLVIRDAGPLSGHARDHGKVSNRIGRKRDGGVGQADDEPVGECKRLRDHEDESTGSEKDQAGIYVIDVRNAADLRERALQDDEADGPDRREDQTLGDVGHRERMRLRRSRSWQNPE